MAIHCGKLRQEVDTVKINPGSAEVTVVFREQGGHFAFGEELFCRTTPKLKATFDSSNLIRPPSSNLTQTVTHRLSCWANQTTEYLTAGVDKLACYPCRANSTKLKDQIQEPGLPSPVGQQRSFPK